MLKENSDNKARIVVPVYNSIMAGFCLVTVSVGLCALGGNEPPTQRGGIDPDYFKALPPTKALLLDLSQLKTGMPLSEVKRQVEYSWEPVLSNHLTGKYPLNELMPYTNRAVVSEWESKKAGELWTFIAIFSDSHKTNLTDAFLYQGCLRIQPMVEGSYQKALLRIKAGDSVEEVYRQLGQKEANYYKGKDGKWRLEFIYMGCNGEFIEIEVDPATGVVTRVTDVTI